MSSWVLVVEDDAGDAVLRRLLREYAPTWQIELVDNCAGVDRMRGRLDQYRNASHVIPHLLLADLDRHECPSTLLQTWNARSVPPRLMLRVAVREVEAWILGDRLGVATWLGVPLSKLPATPEDLADPKQRLLSLGRRSRSHRLRSEFCPAPGSSASQGPLYNEHVRRFVRDRWDVVAARQSVPSLDRTCRRILEWSDALALGAR